MIIDVSTSLVDLFGGVGLVGPSLLNDAINSAVDSGSPGLVLTFPSMTSGGALITTYWFDTTFVLPAGVNFRLLGTGPQSVRIGSGSAVAFEVVSDPLENVLRFERLMFTGSGVAIPASSEDGVYFEDCVFHANRADWAVRGAADGAVGPSNVSIRRCSFVEGGVERGHWPCGSDLDGAIAEQAMLENIGAVWVPRAASGWSIDHCVFASGQGRFLLIEGSETTVNQTDFESMHADIENRDTCVEVQGASDVILTRDWFGTEPCVPREGLALMSRTLPNGSVRNPTNVIFHGANLLGTSTDGDCVGSPAPIGVGVYAPLRGVRITSPHLNSGVLALLVEHPESQSASSVGDVPAQNSLWLLDSSLDRELALPFVAPVGPGEVSQAGLAGGLDQSWGAGFEVLGERLRSITRRDDWSYRETRNLLPGSEPSSETTDDLWPHWSATPAGAWATVPSKDWPGVVAISPMLATRFAGLSIANAGLPGVESSTVLTFSVWWRPGSRDQIEIIVRQEGAFLVRLRRSGRGELERVMCSFVAGPGTLDIDVQLRQGEGKAWNCLLFWPQLEVGGVPTAYRRSYQGLGGGGPGHIWPTRSWSVGPIGIQSRAECAESLMMPGDRQVGGVGGAPIFADASNASWRSLVRVDTPDVVLRPAGRVVGT
jgi:hypothetical protein